MFSLYDHSLVNATASGRNATVTVRLLTLVSTVAGTQAVCATLLHASSSRQWWGQTTASWCAGMKCKGLQVPTIADHYLVDATAGGRNVTVTVRMPTALCSVAGSQSCLSPPPVYVLLQALVGPGHCLLVRVYNL